MASTATQGRESNGVANGVDGARHDTKPDVDTLIIGAGFAGLRMIHEFRKLGLSLKVLEAGSGVGGTWYWNRYPGARTDSESWIYIFNFSKELKDDWVWKERFPRQPEVLEYLNHVADRFDMRKDIQFNTRVESAHYDKAKNIWNVTTETGEKYSCTYLISASGVLSVQRKVPFPGTEKFKGEWYQTSNWPKHQVQFDGKRVAVIGTGATAVQVIPVVAHNAKSVTVFQRTPNYVMPARNHPMTEDQQREIKTRYDEIWQEARTHSFGMSMTDSKVMMSDMKTDAQINRVLERGWESGGFRFVFETFGDLLTSQKANDTAAEFVRNKIRAIVKDEETAELLCPDYPVLAKRPPLGHYYFETFNKPTVSLVDVKSNPIEEITETGLRTGTEEYDFDMIIYAIGFDAATGALASMDIRGRSGESLAERWSKNLETFLGIGVPDYPNMLMLSGPQSPFANLPIILDNTADWIGKLVSYMQQNNYKQVEPTKEATEGWCKLLNDIYHATVLPKGAEQAKSWFIGANVPGKPIRLLFWFGGCVSYFEMCQDEIDNNFPGLQVA